MADLRTNFAHLQQHEEQLLRLGLLAERYFPEDPNTCLLKLRQLAESLAQLTAAHIGVYADPAEPQYLLLRRLVDQGIISREVMQLFDQVRRAGNAASHEGIDDHRTALLALKVTWQLSIWYHRTFKERDFASGAFIPPQRPVHESEELRNDLLKLSAELEQYQASHQEVHRNLELVQSVLRDTEEEKRFWEETAAAVERQREDLQGQLTALQQQASALPLLRIQELTQAGASAANNLQLDETATRQLIDQQLRDAGWETDTQLLRYGSGTRPQKGRNMAIAEWSTASGPADYVLFCGLQPVAAVEAKRSNIDVSAALQQSKRYSRGLKVEADWIANGGPWVEFNLPFVFSTNGRPYLKQIETRSGIWFCDVRQPDNLGRALDGWYTPAGLMALMQIDVPRAESQLEVEPFNYGFDLRYYQKNAIAAVEQGLADGQRAMLLAMATGTGKTKTCIALVYRLLKARRCQRVLFLVDRHALGEQAANSFRDTRMESMQTFADIFGIQDIEGQGSDMEVKVHIATVQSMVMRLLYPSEDAAAPPIDQYDCIVVDECHRGYLLDRELSDTEFTFRGFEDYVSKYRRVLDYFDAIKIGLTATPALHTVQIFGDPIYNYSYREAVIDGYLVDHEPPIQIKTELSVGGIRWDKGAEIGLYDPSTNQIELFHAPDELKFEVDSFNRQVITESFNRVVCEHLALEIDPTSLHKTLVFCATDAHADMVVKLLKEALAARYGSVDDDAVIKITGTADKPSKLIRRFRNELNPNVAVTVDLLTTGIDVHEICNLVFIRRVNSRILYDQMLGRATRLCPEIGKESFHIFDAVGLYDTLKNLSAMQPVVVNPSISFTQLIGELTSVDTDTQRKVIWEQFAAKLQRSKWSMSEEARGDFETVAGMPPAQFVQALRVLPLQEIAEWFTSSCWLSSSRRASTM